MRAFFDIDTQIDFLYPAGALYGKGGERLIAQVATLNHYAIRNKIPLISTMCSHPEDADEFKQWPPHCITGTIGQQKPASLLGARRYVVPNWRTQINPHDVEQILLEKNALDLFTNPNAEQLIAHLKVKECVVYGAFTEYCIQCAITGLLRLGKKVLLVHDAISALDDNQGEEVIRTFTASGGVLTAMSQVMQ